MTFSKVMLWGGLQSAIRLTAGLAATKVLSIYLGPAGLALFAQFQTLCGLLNNFVNGGIQHGIVKRTAELHEKPVEFARMSRNISALSLLFPVLLAVPIIVFRRELAWWLFKAPGLELPLVVYACTLLFTSISATLGAQMTGLQLPMRFFAGQSAVALISLALVVVATPRLGLTGALLTIPLAQVGLFFVVIALCKGVVPIRLAHWRPLLEREPVFDLLRFGALLLVSATATGGSQLYVRDLLIGAHGADMAGHWQAVVRISESLIIVTTSVLTSYYLPKLSAANGAGRRALLRHYFTRVMPLFAAGVVCIVILRERIILVLFTPAFLPGSDLFIPQFAGDAARMAGWIANVALVAMGRTRTAMAAEIAYGFSFVGLASVLVPGQGAIGANIAYLTASFVTALMLWTLLLKTGAISSKTDV